MTMAYDSIKCSGYSATNDGDEVTYDLIVNMSRADVFEIERFLKFAAEQSDQFGFIRDCVNMVERWRTVLLDHSRIIEEDSDDL